MPGVQIAPRRDNKGVEDIVEPQRIKVLAGMLV